MFATLILILPISVLVVVGVMISAMLNEAFRAESLLGGVSAIPRPTSHSVNVFAAAVRGLTERNALPIKVNVEECRMCVPDVTVPEASAIAEELRARGQRDVDVVLQRCRQHGRACPLLSKSGICACSIARPLSCIDRCSLGVDSPEWATGLGQATATAFQHHLQSHHQNAATRRLDEALLSILESSC